MQIHRKPSLSLDFFDFNKMCNLVEHTTEGSTIFFYNTGTDLTQAQGLNGCALVFRITNQATGKRDFISLSSLA